MGNEGFNVIAPRVVNHGLRRAKDLLRDGANLLAQPVTWRHGNSVPEGVLGYWRKSDDAIYFFLAAAPFRASI